MTARSGSGAAQQPDPDRPGEGPTGDGRRDADQPSSSPMHPSLVPQGESVAWSALGSLLAGPIVWGGVGYLLDQWLDTGRVLTAIGVVVGCLASFYIVYVRFGRDT